MRCRLVIASSSQKKQRHYIHFLQRPPGFKVSMNSKYSGGGFKTFIPMVNVLSSGSDLKKYITLYVRLSELPSYVLCFS